MAHRMLVSNGENDWVHAAWYNFTSVTHYDALIEIARDVRKNEKHISAFLNHALEPWQGVVFVSGKYTHIDFETPEAAILWTLRWS